MSQVTELYGEDAIKCTNLEHRVVTHILVKEKDYVRLLREWRLEDGQGRYCGNEKYFEVSLENPKVAISLEDKYKDYLLIRPLFFNDEIDTKTITITSFGVGRRLNKIFGWDKENKLDFRLRESYDVDVRYKDINILIVENSSVSGIVPNGHVLSGSIVHDFIFDSDRFDETMDAAISCIDEYVRSKE